MVTDEEENTETHGYRFAPLFKKYKEEVCPESKLVFVSFLSDPTSKGQMVEELARFDIKPLQFKLDSKRPDLTKVDTLLSLLSSESSLFKKQTTELAVALEKGLNLNTSLLKSQSSSKNLRKLQDNVTICFSIHYITYFGENMLLIASIPEFGCWNINRAQKMIYTEGGNWKFEITLKRSQIPFEYKYLIWNSKTKIALWEPSSNRTMKETQSATLKDKWGIIY